MITVLNFQKCYERDQKIMAGSQELHNRAGAGDWINLIA